MRKAEERRATPATCCVLSLVRYRLNRKVGLLNRRGAESCGQRRDQKLHAVVAKNAVSRRPFFEFQLWKITRRSRSIFQSSDVRKMHAIVPRSTFPSKHLLNGRILAYFLKFKCAETSQLASDSMNEFVT